MTGILFISSSDVKELVSMRDIVGAVEDAFRAYGTGNAKLAPIVLTMIDKYEGEHEIKSGYVDGYCIGTKVLTFYKNNRSRHGLPNLRGLIVLNSLDDGRPIAVIDGTYITAARTGAAGAVAAKHLARKDSQHVGVIGAGTQGRYQVAALSEILTITRVRVYDINNKNARDYVEEMAARHPFSIEQAESPAAAVEDADIIVTATPSTSTLIQDEWIRDGVHINAIGADSPGKRELDPVTIARAKVVVDSKSQCVERGEIQTAVSTGLLGEADIYAELSDIVLGRRPGRVNAREITLFDATGLAVQDITTAYTVLEAAKRQGLGTTVPYDQEPQVSA